MEEVKIAKVIYSNFKALSNYLIVLGDMNILVGPNNSGKSTIISAFRLLSLGIKKARSKKPEKLRVNDSVINGFVYPRETGLSG